ncbi:MAG: DNA adenine methylase [Omnitrophica WOR_2 bacterium]
MYSPSYQYRVRPFAKWAGGKAQLLGQMHTMFPAALRQGKIYKYVEPFVGGGAVFFSVASSYPVDELIIADVNPELMLVYRTLQKAVQSLIARLEELQRAYLPLKDTERRNFFYQIREQFNQQRSRTQYAAFQEAWIERAAQFIFLNRTCFNGLFRVNSKGIFNVSFGRYTNPTLYDADNLLAVSRILQKAVILTGDFSCIEPYVDHHTFVYLDPPYRPISKTAYFTSYYNKLFTDEDQIRLAHFYRRLDTLGARLMLSNSDPKNQDKNDEFFERAYTGYRILRVKAARMINSKAEKRGRINEIIVMNYRE